MTLWNLDWDTPAGHISTVSTIPPFPILCYRAGVPRGWRGGGGRPGYIKEPLPPRGGRGDVSVSPLRGEMTGLSLGLTMTDRYNGVNGSGAKKRVSGT